MYFSGYFDGTGAPSEFGMRVIARQGSAVIAAGTTSMRRCDGTQDTDFVLSKAAAAPAPDARSDAGDALQKHPARSLDPLRVDPRIVGRQQRGDDAADIVGLADAA